MPTKSIKQSAYEAGIFFITLKTIKDLHVFTDKQYFQAIIDSLRYCQEHKGLLLYAYAILINHLHLIFSANNGQEVEFLRDFKRHTTKVTLELLRKDNREKELNLLRYSAIGRKRTFFRLWKKAVHPEEIKFHDFFQQKVKYVDFNPVHHNIVEDIEMYPYSSFHNHYCSHEVVLRTFLLPSID